VIEDSGTPVIGGVAVIAEVVALDMIGRFARGNLVIMTTVTSAYDRKMIDTGYRTPCPRRVAIVTAVGTLNMIRGFTGSLGAVMAG